MELQKLLGSSAPDQWVTRQAIVFDWYDGPREGVCALKKPGGEFYFSLFWERHDPDDLDERFFRVKEIPSGSVDELLSLLSELGSPTQEVWIPFGKFPHKGAQEKADLWIKEVERKARPTNLIIRTRNMRTFQDQWTVAAEEFSEKDPESVIALLGQRTP